MGNQTFLLLYRSKKRTASAHFSARKDGVIRFTHPKSRKHLFDLHLGKDDFQNLRKVLKNPKRATGLRIVNGKDALKAEMSWSDQLRAKPLAALRTDGALVEAVRIASPKEEDGPQTMMDPVTGGVIIVAIIAGAWLGSKAMENGSTLKVDVDIPNAKISVGVDGDGPPQLPDGGGGDDGGDDNGDDGGSSPTPTPNPGDNSPTPA